MQMAQTEEIKTATPVIVNRKRKRTEAPLLFPGYLLNEKARNNQHAATVVGSIFEGITQKMLCGERLITASAYELNPDVVVERSNLYVESKAVGLSKRMLLEDEQLDRYNMMAQGCMQAAYCLWHYTAKRPTVAHKGKQTFGAIIENIRSTIQWAFLAAVKIMSAMKARRKLIPGLEYRKAHLYFSGGRDATRHYFVLCTGFIERFMAAPADTLELLGLDTKDYEWARTRRRITFKFNDVQFVTSTFDFMTVQERVPF